MMRVKHESSGWTGITKRVKMTKGRERGQHRWGVKKYIYCIYKRKNKEGNADLNVVGKLRC